MKADVQDDEPRHFATGAGSVEVLHECIGCSQDHRLFLTNERRCSVEHIVRVRGKGGVQDCEGRSRATVCKVQHAFDPVLWLHERLAGRSELREQGRHRSVDLRFISVV